MIMYELLELDRKTVKIYNFVQTKDYIHIRKCLKKWLQCKVENIDSYAVK